MKASDFIASFLKINGIGVVYEMIGGMTAHLIDSIYRIDGISIVSLHHEQAAGFAAEGFGRIKGIPGVALATSGPGATNLVTAIGSCFYDSVPTIFITGQVNTYEQKKSNSQIRQLGFQETDIVSIVKPITKYAKKIETVDEIPSVLEHAFKVSINGRPGPVLIDIPMDLQRGELVDVARVININQDSSLIRPCSPDIIECLIEAIKTSERPLILIGGGIRSSRTAESLDVFVKRVQIPVVYSLMGWDAFSDDKLRIGFIGSYGNRWANFALSDSDLLIVLGSRLDVRQTGAQTESFSKGKTIFHVDCENDEINNRVKGCHSIVSTLQNFFQLMDVRFQDKPFLFKQQDWIMHLSMIRDKYSDTNEIKGIKGINPNIFLKELSMQVPSGVNYVTDVGQHQMWAAQSIVIKPNQRFLTSGGMGSMGFGLPTAIGSYFASGNHAIVIVGDGGLQCNIQELETVSFHNLPIKIIVMNNNSLGMVRQFQESYFENRYQSTVWGYSAPSFERVSQAYNIEAMKIEKVTKMKEAILWLLEGSDPKMLEVLIETNTPVNPKLTYGQPLSKMSPELDN